MARLVALTIDGIFFSNFDGWRSHMGEFSSRVRACLHGGGGPQIGEVECDGSSQLTCKREQIKTRDYMDRRVTPPKQFTSPNWDPPPPC